MEILKREVETRFDFTPLAAFRSVDRYNVGKIDSISLGAYLRANGHHSSEIELLAIIRRIDTDGDASLNFNEFAEFLRTGAPHARRPDQIYDNNSSPIRGTRTASVYSREHPPRGNPNKPLLPTQDEDELINSLRE